MPRAASNQRNYWETAAGRRDGGREGSRKGQRPRFARRPDGKLRHPPVELHQRVQSRLVYHLGDLPAGTPVTQEMIGEIFASKTFQTRNMMTLEAQ